MNSDCIFCRIACGDIPAEKVYENESVLAFKDINPQAPVHIVIIPKEHIVSAADINEDNSYVVAKCFEVVSVIALQLGLNDGFRVITNSGYNGCQSVKHLHFHLLGGTKLPENIV